MLTNLLYEEEEHWYYAPDRDFPLQQSSPQDMAELLAGVTAGRELTGRDDLEDYGLDEPEYTIEFTEEDGASTTLYFGDVTGDNYYVTTGEKEIVYTVSTEVIDGLNVTLEDMAELDEYPSVGSGNLVRETITEDGASIVYDSENEEQSEDIAAIAGGLGAVTLSEAADYSVDPEDLAGYGLDEDSRITVEAVYTEEEEEQTLTLYMGNGNGDGDRYVMINDSRIVYLISEEICDNILNLPDEDE